MGGSSSNYYCIIKLNADKMTGGWAENVDDAIYNWNNYSAGKIKIQKTSKYQSNVELMVFSGEWPYVKCVAFTTIFDKYDNGFNGGITNNYLPGSSVPVSKFGYRIDYACVIFNPDYRNGSDMNKTKSIVHEIGHCVNLGHRPYDQSIMQQGWNLGWSNYDRPTDIDRSDLINYYHYLYK